MATSLEEGGNANLNTNVSGNKVNIGELKDCYRADLFAFLDDCAGNKILVWDDELTGPVGLLCDLASLEAREVQKRMWSLSVDELPRDNECQNVIFLMRPVVQLVCKAADLVLRDHRYSSRITSHREYHILFMPRKCELCLRKLNELGAFDLFSKIDELNAHLLPLDTDLLSMNYPDCVKELYLSGDFSYMFDIAISIMKLQSIYGVIPKLYCKGECAKRVLNIITRLRREQAGSEEHITPQIDNLILIDRSTDHLTPFFSQLTYEGFIDEIFGIKNNSIKIPADRLPSNTDQTDPAPSDKKVILNSGDQLFSQLRDKNFNAVGPALSAKAKAVSAQYEERNQAKSIGELKQFVSKLPRMQAERQSVTIQTAIAQMIKENIATESFKDRLFCQQELRMGVDVDKVNNYIDDCISRKEELTKVLRLIAIQSYCGNGLKTQVLQYYKTAVVQVYGFKSIVLFNNMEKAGFIRTQASNKAYSTLKKSLNLLVEDVNEQYPTDAAYVYSGYAPISVRIIQNTIKPGWKAISSSLQLLPGEMIEEVQQIPGGLRKQRGSFTSSDDAQTEGRVTLVFFIGGVTYAEIAALRFLQQDDHPTDYIIATTHIVNGDTLINSLNPLLTADDTGSLLGR